MNRVLFESGGAILAVLYFLAFTLRPRFKSVVEDSLKMDKDGYQLLTPKFSNGTALLDLGAARRWRRVWRRPNPPLRVLE